MSQPSPSRDAVTAILACGFEASVNLKHHIRREKLLITAMEVKPFYLQYIIFLNNPIFNIKS